MNTGHAKLADWGFTHLPAMTLENGVDLGCGGGRNAGELLKMFPKAHVTAIDYSELSVEKAKDYNKAMIAVGRCETRFRKRWSFRFSEDLCALSIFRSCFPIRRLKGSAAALTMTLPINAGK